MRAALHLSMAAAVLALMLLLFAATAQRPMGDPVPVAPGETS